MKSQFGWNGFFEKTFKSHYNEDFLPGRILADLGNHYNVVTQNGYSTVEKSTPDYKAVVGDFVVFNKNSQHVIHQVLPRLSSYKLADGKVLAANFDTLFIVNSLTNLNVRNLEKCVLHAWETGSVPVVILSKKDLCEDYVQKVAEVKLVAPGVDVYAVSAVTMDGMDDLYKYLKVEKTIAIIGSDTEGKSTLLRQLSNQEDISGRQLHLLKNGSMIIDLDENKEDEHHEQEQDAYHDLDDLVLKCRFYNCTHTNEPGCAVIHEIEKGTLSLDRLNKYLKKQKVDLELTEDEIIHIDRKRYKETYNKGRKREQW